MNKKLGLGIAAAAITSGLVYLFKKKNGTKMTSTPESAKRRHRRDVLQNQATTKSPLQAGEF
jgi:hypothetical protein